MKFETFSLIFEIGNVGEIPIVSYNSKFVSSIITFFEIKSLSLFISLYSSSLFILNKLSFNDNLFNKFYFPVPSSPKTIILFISVRFSSILKY